jgi:hypothetical protein
MRTRNTIAIFTALALLMFAFLWGSAVRPFARPSIAIGVLSYSGPGNDFVHVGITNLGLTAIRHSGPIFDPDAWVLTASRTGLATRGVGPVGGGRWPRVLLRPGSNTVAYVWLPPGTLRWRVAYRVRHASLRQRVESAVPDKLRSLLYPLCDRLLSDTEGPEQEIQSGRFECPHNEPPTVDGGMGFLFSSDTFWPAATEARR